MGEQRENNLRDYRRRSGMTQAKAVEAIKRRAKERGDPVEPGLDTTSVCRHEKGHKWPSLHYQTLYCEVYGATPEQLGFRVALPGESGHHEDVDRRKFLIGAAEFMVTLALPTPTRLGSSDIASLRDSIFHLYELDDLHGAGSVYSATGRTFQRLHSLVERASYNHTTGQALRELTGLTAEHAGWLAFDSGQHDDAHRWWLEAMKWARLAESNSVSVVVMGSMSMQASDQHRPREATDLATAAQSTAKGVATPRLISVLLAREALGHAGQGDPACAHAALRRAHRFIDRAHDDDPSWIAFYGPANFASQEHRVALMLADTAAAEESARTALALNDPVGYPRNHALYLTNLANVLVQRRELDEAAAVAKQATVAAVGLDSARVTQALHAVKQSLAA